MSYILEALKKSQHERELGRVPTLRTPDFPTEEKNTRPNLWVLLALILATLAVAIALYSALRGGPSVDEPVTTTPRTARTATREPRDRDAAMARQPTTRPLPREVFPQQPVPVASGHRGPANAPPVYDPVEPETVASPPVMELPAPVSPPPRRRVPASPVTAEDPPVAPTQEQTGKIPSDLIADIEAFKREIREWRPDTTAATRLERKTAPRDLRLPPAVRDRLPLFVMAAHIYDREPSRRFVLINSLKIREGEMSREGILVERILPDGAVLSFDGHRFFQRR